MTELKSSTAWLRESIDGTFEDCITMSAAVDRPTVSGRVASREMLSGTFQDRSLSVCLRFLLALSARAGVDCSCHGAGCSVAMATGFKGS